MSDAKKIVVLIIIGILLIGFFFYAILSDQNRTGSNTDSETDQVPAGTQQGDAIEDTDQATGTPENNESATSSEADGKSREKENDSGQPASSDAGMEFPVSDS